MDWLTDIDPSCLQPLWREALQALPIAAVDIHGKQLFISKKLSEAQLNDAQNTFQFDLEQSTPAVFEKKGQHINAYPLINKQGVVTGQLLFFSKPPPHSATGSEKRLFHGMVSLDPAMHHVFDIIQNVAKTDATVLIRGESGTGKELVAHAIHLESPRRTGPFIALNCATMTPNLLESQLFGHVRGAFTGAERDYKGVFQQAHSGTLFLDEVAEIPLALQAKLLRVLQDHAITPLGSEKTFAVDVRIIAATHRAMREEVKQGRFREDLMYRLRVVPVFLPPLRERQKDIELLLWHFIERHNQRGQRQINTINSEALKRLRDHSWPGNIREMENIIEHSYAVGQGPELCITDLPPELQTNMAATNPTLFDEAARIRTALSESQGNTSEAAKLLNISRTSLWRKRKKYGL